MNSLNSGVTAPEVASETTSAMVPRASAACSAVDCEPVSEESAESVDPASLVVSADSPSPDEAASRLMSMYDFSE